MKKNSGFTLVELLVVIAIIGILIGMLLPAVQQVREAARRSKCQNNLKQLSLACLNYESANMKFPAADQIPNRLQPSGKTARGSNWMIQILPFVEQQNVLTTVDYDFNNADNLIMAGGFYDLDQNGNGKRDGVDLAPTEIISCPTVDSPGWARDYFGVQGGQEGFLPDHEFSDSRGPIHNDGILGLNIGRSIGAVTDGTSNTLILGENYLKQKYGFEEGGASGFQSAQPGFAPWWMGGGTAGNQASIKIAEGRFANPARHVLTANSPINDPTFFEGGSNYNKDSKYHWHPFSSQHPGGANFAFSDGHVGFITDNADVLVFREAASMDRGGIVDFNSL